MKILVGLAIVSAIGIGVALQRSQEYDLYLLEIQADGSWRIPGTLSLNGQPRRQLDLDPREERPTLHAGDSVTHLRVSQRLLSIGYRTWAIERGGVSQVHTFGKFRYTSILWGLTLAPLVLGVLACAILVNDGRRVTP